MSAPGDLRLLRHVPGTTPVHRLWAGTKLLVVAAISIAVVARPDWSGLAIAAGVVAAAALIARLPIGAAPKPPSWLVGLFLLGGAFALFAGGEPYVHIGAQTIGLGGAIDWLRFTILGLVVLGLAVVLTATTPVADLPEALGRLLGPLRRLRVPVDELVAAITLSVRCLPMLISELQTLLAAWRLRRPSQPTGWRSQVIEAHDMLTTTLAVAVRRAVEMGDAIDRRGGPGPITATRVRLRPADVVALGFGVLGTVAIALL
jgi:energy-coupling factor transporter transmembrane protein EcfT